MKIQKTNLGHAVTQRVLVILSDFLTTLGGVLKEYEPTVLTKHTRNEKTQSQSQMTFIGLKLTYMWSSWSRKSFFMIGVRTASLNFVGTVELSRDTFKNAIHVMTDSRTS